MQNRDKRTNAQKIAHIKRAMKKFGDPNGDLKKSLRDIQKSNK
jgi:hypothetical protein